MATLFLDRKDLNLRLDARRLVIEEPGERPRAIPLAQLERVVIQGRVRLDSALLGALGEQGIGVLMLSARRSRQRGFLYGPGHADVRRRLAQYRLSSDTELRLAWSRALVAGKLQAQRQVLRDALGARADLRRRLSTGIARLDELLPALEQAPDLDVVRGLEGAGAAAYFGAFTALFPAQLDFTGRNRRPPRDPVNACLSLVYTLLHVEAVRACHGAGLDPLLGFYHEPAYGRESLACDLIEPLRPRVDRWAWGLFRERELRADHFATEQGACLLQKAGRRVFYIAYETAAPRLRRYLRRQSYRLAGALLKLAPDLQETDE